MTLVAVELNASRARAVHGLSPRELRPLSLTPEETDLPMAFGLAGRQPELGAAGEALVRRSPHLACTSFLPHLGETREWSGPRVRLDASLALTLVLEHIASRCGKHNVAVIGMPGYLNPTQRGMARKLTTQARLKLHGTIDLALAAVLAAHAEQPWHGPALVVDVDEHALSWTTVAVGDGQARLLSTETYPHLSLRIW